MKYPENIRELIKLPIDYMGMIFYEKSPRYIYGLSGDELNTIPENIKLVGVFVNSDLQYIADNILQYSLDVIQLHGNESPEVCKELNELIPVVKAFSIAEASDFILTKEYEGTCTYFLFDTKTPQYGGSGQKFDWNILNEYNGLTPFFLSGGISIDDVDAIKNIKHPRFTGIDLNSRFETALGLKNIQLLEQFIKQL